MAKPRLEKVRALFYVLQQLTKIGCANFDTASLTYIYLYSGCTGVHPYNMGYTCSSLYLLKICKLPLIEKNYRNLSTKYLHNRTYCYTFATYKRNMPL